MANPERIQTLFVGAIELSADARAAYLDAECGGDLRLRAEVESLLKSHDAAGAFLSMPTVGDGTWTAPIAPSTLATVAELPGTRIGPYTLIEKIGEGGFGTVFLAEQSTPVARKVALKIIKLGMDTRQVVARFEHERQALAMMEHPGIARVFDAGATDTGRPYFVMELVRGEPMVDYCDTHHLSIDARLALFAEVCLAVQHAHTKGIIHRDLKPTNIIVTTQDGKPHAKIIDFGIAKAIDSRLAERAAFTELRQLVGTPEYMSPEQAEGALDVDTRTDVYSLGVMLYELLTGTTPFVGRELRSAAFVEMQRIIREIDPPTPSTRLSINTETIASVAARRQVAPRRLGSLVKGELDWVVMKALEKDRQRRYDSANDFAADVRRYLTGEAVVAAPPGTWYRTQKFIQRNRTLIAAAGAVVAALLVGIAGTTWQATIAAREADAARLAERAATLARNAERSRADELKEVADFQARMLAEIDPARAGEEIIADVRARHLAALEKAGVLDPERSSQVESLQQELLRVNATDTAAAMFDRTILKPAISTIDQQFGDQPVVDAALREGLAFLYQSIGLYDAAAPLRSSALDTRRRMLGDDHPDTLDSLSGMGNLLLSQAKSAEAEPLLREALERKRRVLGDSARPTLRAIGDMGALLRAQSRLADAERFFREALDGSRRFLGEDDLDTLIAINNLGYVLLAQGKLDEADPLFREALDRRRKLLGDDHRDTLFSLNNLGTLFQAQGKPEDAEASFRAALEGRRRILGEDHPETITSINDLGNLLRSRGRLAEAEPLLREALEKSQRVLGPEHRHTLTAMNNVAMVLRARGQLDEAERWYREVLSQRRRLLGDAHLDTLISINNLAFVLHAQTKVADAESLYREGFESSRRALGDSHARTVTLGTQLGRVLQQQGKNRAAHEVLAPIEPAARHTFVGADAERLAVFLTALGRARLGDDDNADRFRAAEPNLLDARRVYADLRGTSHPDTIQATKTLIEFYNTWNKSDSGKGYDARAEQWMAELERHTTRPATTSRKAEQ